LDFKKRKVTRDELLKYFKGERWSTAEVVASAEARSAGGRRTKGTRAIRKAVSKAEAVGPLPSEDRWLGVFVSALESGPEWSQEVARGLAAFVRQNLLEPLKQMLPTLERVERSGGAGR
jgi:hypothetical protein